LSLRRVPAKVDLRRVDPSASAGLALARPRA